MTWRWLAGAVVCAIVLATLLGYTWYKNIQAQEAAAASFYSKALRSANVRTKVMVGGQLYEESGGAIAHNGALLAGIAAYPALRIAFVQALAERNPLLDLSGVDPQKLATATEALKNDMVELASVQANSSNANLVASLYPIAFLRTLSALERARLAFVASGADTDEAQYEAALKAAAETGIADSTAFSGAFLEAFPQATSTSFLIASLGGALSETSLRAAPKAEVLRMNAFAAGLTQWLQCAKGVTAQCGDIYPALPVIAPVESTPVSPNASRISNIVSQVFFSPQTDTRVFVLASSTCLAALPGPYYFVADPSGASPFFYYVGDLFLQPILPGTPAIYSYLAQHYGVSYAFVNPTQFYQCPEVGSDYGRIRALSAIAAFAEANPWLQPTLRAPIIGNGILTESDSVAYLRALLAQEESAPDANLPQVIRLALMYRDRAGGLETVVSNIASVNDLHVQDVRDHLQFNLSATVLFLTHSAMPTLFLSDNPSSGSTLVSMRDDRVTTSSVRALFFKQVQTYTELSTSVSAANLLKDLMANEQFNQAH